MAQQQIAAKRVNPASRASKYAPIIRLPTRYEAHVTICQAIGICTSDPIMIDRAGQSIAISTPFVGAILCSNMIGVCESGGGDAAKDAYERASNLVWKMAWNSLLHIDNFDLPTRDAAAAEITQSKKAAPGRFEDALAQAIKETKIGFTRDKDGVSIPVVYDALTSHAKNVKAFARVLEIGEAFEKKWGWHCDPLRAQPKELIELRQKKRARPVYNVIHTKAQNFIATIEKGDPAFSSEDLKEANLKLDSLEREVMHGRPADLSSKRYNNFRDPTHPINQKVPNIDLPYERAIEYEDGNCFYLYRANNIPAFLNFLKREKTPEGEKPQKRQRS